MVVQFVCSLSGGEKIMTDTRWYTKRFYAGVSVFYNGNVISCIFLCFPGKWALNI